MWRVERRREEVIDMTTGPVSEGLPRRLHVVGIEYRTSRRTQNVLSVIGSRFLAVLVCENEIRMVIVHGKRWGIGIETSEVLHVEPIVHI